ncbi:MAG: NPCBM/NEW2 domain-containing protein [Pirellulales bacterium]|nr:NPCBM/NEW2 domain-containing protein [Pirellulales bacterium]
MKSPSGRVVPLDGQPFQARFVGVDAGGQWTFAAEGSRRTLPAQTLVRWGRPAEPARGPVVVLADGGLLPAEPLRIDKGKMIVESDAFGRLRVPLESSAGVLLAWPTTSTEQDLLVDRLLQAKGPSDQVLLANGDQLAGVVAQIDPQKIQLEIDGQPTNLVRELVTAVVFNPTLRAELRETASRAWVGLDDGTRLLVNRLLLEGPSLQLVPAAVDRASPPWSTKAQRCVFLQPLGGRAVYLSDRLADDYRHVPFLDLPWPYHNDRNVLGRRLRASGQTYLKGLGVHSQAQLTYRLNGRFDQFETELALDDATKGGGSVVYHVRVDGRHQFSSEPVRGGDRPVPIRIDLAGAKQLELIVDFGERADQLDYADWLDARLIRSEASSGKAPAESSQQAEPKP